MKTAKKVLVVLIYCLALILLLSLGTWQVKRGLHKSDVLSLTRPEHKTYEVLASLPRSPDTLEALNYQKVALNGTWQAEKNFLLANRIHQGQLGYEVLTPFRLSDETLLLINRGWIAQAQAAQQGIPDLTASAGRPEGQLYLPDKGYTIGVAISPEALADPKWPKTSLYMDIEAFSAALKVPLMPVVLVLSPSHPDSLTRIWKPVVIEPERHYAYALQWYGLAIVFIVFGVIWYRRR